MKKHFLTLSSSDFFDLVIGVESANARCYGEWADRFRPFNGAVSDLFDDMADRSDRYGKDLSFSQDHMADTDKSSPADSDSRAENVIEAREHFFVVDKAMARCILRAAVNSLSKLRYFYKSILVMTRDVLLRQTCEARAPMHLGDIGKLNRFLDQYPS